MADIGQLGREVVGLERGTASELVMLSAIDHATDVDGITLSPSLLLLLLLPSVARQLTQSSLLFKFK